MSLTVIIPSKNERFLQKTILDVLQKAEGSVEVIPVLDGYEPPKEELVIDSRVHYLRLPATPYMKKRHGINLAVEMAEGDFVMALDAHCLVAPGFDKVLIENHQPDAIQVLRRQRLDPENWCLQSQDDGRPPIDYEYLMWPLKWPVHSLHGYKWDAKTIDRSDIPIDETCEFQGSQWFMSKEFFKEMGFMKTEGYGGWGSEAEELTLSTYRAGGRVLTNKLSYYAHLHKGRRYGRMYHMNVKEARRSYLYAYDYWVYDNKDFFISFIERFGPLPGWPKDWKGRLYK